MKYIKRFSDLLIGDINEVGGKNASLGEMITKLTPRGILIPDGFAVTASAFKHFISYNKLDGVHNSLLKQLNRKDFSNLDSIGAKARELILHVRVPGDLAEAILTAYDEIFKGRNPQVAVRSSATAEDLPDASFAGQHESYLNIRGGEELINAVKQCFASLYTNRAIKYREDTGFDHSKIYISVGIQEMVRADKGCSGVGFTIEPESGFPDVIHLAGVWGLGENIVQGTVTPDEFLVFKPTLRMQKEAIIQKTLGGKEQTMIYSDSASQSTMNTDTPEEIRNKFVLSDAEIYRLANWALIIGDHYQKPMDLEWAKDGITNKLYILQARPETVHSRKSGLEITEYRLTETGNVIAEGQAIGSKITSGRARVIQSPDEAGELMQGDILVTDLTSPDWDPILKRVAAIVTNKGGRTSHASIIARELGVPAIVGTGNATGTIKDGQTITVSCAEGETGAIYEGNLHWEETVIDLSGIRLPDHPKLSLILGEPEKAFMLSFYPNHGIGLMRIEFIISHYIQAHPMALVNFNTMKDQEAKQKIAHLARNYEDKKVYFIDRLSQGVATIAAAFYPREVIVRMSDFKTNEYANLPGGKEFEPEEENPMLGFRGASRYYSDFYKEGFRLECEAMKRVRDDMGFDNVKLMIPFCRTPLEGRKVVDLMKQYGLEQGKNNLEIYVMAEIPSNILLAEQFSAVFDGFSIGSNDLTQLTLGVDRDSSLVAPLFNENNEASRILIHMLIDIAHKNNKKVGICGQGPGDSPEFAQFLVQEGIDSISFNPDLFLKGVGVVADAVDKETHLV
ncbi:MAG TPA: phosphoenolpyruvate synthase [Sphingobacteriaceae bacterium]